MPDLTIDIRRANRHDAAQISTVGRRSFSEAYWVSAEAVDLETFVEDQFGESAIEREMQLASVEYLLATGGQACAGMIKLRDRKPPRPAPLGGTIEVQQLYVAADHQGQGIGARLLDSAVDRARERGKKGIWLSAWSEADWATGFYFKYGFESLGEIPFVIGRTEYVDYLMWLPVDGN